MPLIFWLKFLKWSIKRRNIALPISQFLPLHLDFGLPHGVVRDEGLVPSGASASRDWRFCPGHSLFIYLH